MPCFELVLLSGRYRKTKRNAVEGNHVFLPWVCPLTREIKQHWTQTDLLQDFEPGTGRHPALLSADSPGDGLA